MRESATLIQCTLTGNVEDNTVERLYSEAKRIFTEKARMEWEYRTEGIALPGDWISSLEVLVSYDGLNSYIIKTSLKKCHLRQVQLVEELQPQLPLSLRVMPVRKRCELFI